MERKKHIYRQTQTRKSLRIRKANGKYVQTDSSNNNSKYWNAKAGKQYCLCKCKRVEFILVNRWAQKAHSTVYSVHEGIED